MSVYKKSLHAFFLRVHPDFARSPEWQLSTPAADTAQTAAADDVPAVGNTAVGSTQPSQHSRQHSTAVNVPATPRPDIDARAAVARGATTTTTAKAGAATASRVVMRAGAATADAAPASGTTRSPLTARR
jgi:hypothetical protein